VERSFFILSLLLAAAAHAQTTVDDASVDAPDLFARDSYRIDTLVCPFKGRIDYEAGDIECGLLQVPENREDPDSRFIELHFIKLASTWDDEEEEEKDDEEDSGLAPGKRDDPIIYLTGGPGASAEYYVGRFKDHGIRKHRDLYILEQRGIANSGDFCETYFSRNPEVGNVDSFEKSAEASRIAAEDCARNAMAAGVDITAYNTIENARDVKALRMALGFDKWNVWGISYGTLLGQAYIKEDPEGILAVVLDAIVPLDARADVFSWRMINWYDRDLAKLDELCEADTGCSKSFPDLGERVRDAARATMDDPIVVDVKDTELCCRRSFMPGRMRSRVAMKICSRQLPWRRGAISTASARACTTRSCVTTGTVRRRSDRLRRTGRNSRFLPMPFRSKVMRRRRRRAVSISARRRGHRNNTLRCRRTYRRCSSRATWTRLRRRPWHT
jgi:pimeloyl-ACP methyl ester carboxylesterase